MQPEIAAALPDAVERFDSARLLVVGDLMLDRFIYGSVSRISPEAPVPVMHKQSEAVMLGGAGNVVRNILSLGASCSFISVIGDDATGHQLTAKIGEEARLEPWLITETGRSSTEKSRFVAGSQQLLRCDDESLQAITPETQQQILDMALRSLPEVQLLILSDYGKGVLSDDVIRGLIDAATEQKIPVFVDPKRTDWSVYRGATLLSPNLSELRAACGKMVKGHAEICDAARALCAQHGIANLLVTRGPEGMSLVQGDADLHIPAQAREVFDVSGAGDTVIATLAVAAATGLALAEAAQLANLAGGIVVGRMGTATIFRTDLKTALWQQQQNLAGGHKIYPQDLAEAQVKQWKADGRNVGFTNGCFDVLHVGHLQSLQDAKSYCDRLIVAVNADASVKRLKGEERPVNAEMDRATLLAGLDCVDMVVIFREDTPEALISRLQPDVLMKGADYTEEQVVGRDIVLKYGGRVALLPIREGYSTTATLQRVKNSG
jgi:D-beta-D-heptose 7-phosphate kinase/D-beta-D-heptose 1-phosphate adenosyltransferase